MGLPAALAPKNKHEQVLALYAGGWRRQEIAQHVGYTPEYISKIVNDPDNQDMIVGLQQLNIQRNLTRSVDILNDSATEAILTIRHIMRTASSDNVRLAAANSLLDRAGISKKTVLEVRDEKPISDEAAKFIMRVFKETTDEPPTLEMVEDSGGVFIVDNGDGSYTQVDDMGGYGGPPE